MKPEPKIEAEVIARIPYPHHHKICEVLAVIPKGEVFHSIAQMWAKGRQIGAAMDMTAFDRFYPQQKGPIRNLTNASPELKGLTVVFPEVTDDTAHDVLCVTEGRIRRRWRGFDWNHTHVLIRFVDDTQR